MSNNMNYARSIRNLASMFRDMEAAADALEKLGSVEQAIEEGTRARDEAYAEKQALEATANDLRKAVEEAAEEAKAIISAARERGEVEGKAIVAAAEDAAKRTANQAELDTAAMFAEARAKKDELLDEIEALGDKHSALVSDIALLQEARKQEEAALADVRTQLEGLKRQLKNLLA